MAESERLTGLEVKTNLKAGRSMGATPNNLMSHLTSPTTPCGGNPPHKSEDKTSYGRDLALGGVVLLGWSARSLILPTLVVSSTPIIFAVTASAAAITGFRYLRGLWQTVTGQQKITLDTLAGAATVATLASGGAVTALSAVWALNFSQYLKTQANILKATNTFTLNEGDVWLVLNDKNQTKVQRSIQDIQPQDIIMIYPGQRILVDGQVIKGQGKTNEKLLSGNRKSITKTVGDFVFAGSILLSGELQVRVEAMGSNTAYIRLVQKTTNRPESTQRFETLVRSLAIAALITAGATYLYYFAFVFTLPTIPKYANPIDDVNQLINVLRSISYAPLIYILIYALPIPFLSAGLLTVAGGLLYGFFLGYVYVTIASLASAAIGYAIGYYFSNYLTKREPIKSFLDRYAVQLRQNPFETVLSMRLLFLPFATVSYLAGILQIDFQAFMLGTLIGDIPGTISFLLVGISLDSDNIQGIPSINLRMLATGGTILIGSLALSRYLKERQALEGKLIHHLQTRPPIDEPVSRKKDEETDDSTTDQSSINLLPSPI